MSKNLIYILDDDQDVRQSLVALLESAGLNCVAFESGNDFLVRITEQAPTCAIMDIRMPGVNGLELLAIMRNRGLTLPVIVITGHGDIATAVQSMKLGAVDVLQKPFPEESLLNAIKSAVDGKVNPSVFHIGSAPLMDRSSLTQDVQQRLRALSPREKEILDLIVSGKASREIASDLNISVATVNNHRTQIKMKMGARTMAHMLSLVNAGIHA